MIFQLKLKSKDGTEQTVPLPDGDHLIGRSRSASIHVTEDDVSGRHLALHVSGESVIAENLSSHGSRTMDSEIELPTPIRPGETVVLSKSLSITLEKIPTPQEMPPHTASSVDLTIVDEPAASILEKKDDNKTIIEAPISSDIDKTILDEPSPVHADIDKTILDEPSPVPADIDKTILDEPSPVFDPNKTDPGNTVCHSRQTQAGQGVSSATVAPDNDPYKTNVMQTRIASAEEIDFLRRQDRKTIRDKKMKYIFGIVIFACLLSGIYFFRGKALEEKLSWPRLDNGNYSEKPFDNGDGGFSNGRFSVIAPLVSSTRSSRSKNGDLLIESRIGRDRDVAIRIVLSVKHNPSFLREDRQKTMNDWIREISSSEGHWNFGQISDLFFIGKNNGLPCLSVSYSREDDKQSWYGEALFFRNGDERIVRLVEIPSSERVRGSDILSNNAFLFFSEKFVENHWEGGGEIYSGNPEDLLNEAKALLVKMSPATWGKISAILRSVLVVSAESGNTNLKERSLEQLRKLRSAQRVWYNAQCIAYLKEKAAGNERAADIIRDSCLSVFSAPDDLRNQNIKRNRWE